MTFKKTLFSVATIFAILIVAMTAIICCPIESSASAQTQDESKVIVNQMTAFAEPIQNERLFKLTKNHIEINMDPTANIANTKQLLDFDGNKYALFELNPIGYIIYHIESGKYIEYAEESYSPYLGLDENLYYGGAMQYYYLHDGKLQHTLKKELSLSVDTIAELSEDSKNMSKGFCINSATENINFIEKGTKIIGNTAIKGVVEQKEKSMAKANASARISMASYFPNLTTSQQIGYRGGGVCGYIATNLIIGYNYFAFDYGLISNSSYIDFTNKTMNGPGLTNRLLVLAGENPSNSSFSGTDALAMFNVLRSYLNEVPNQQAWSYSWYLLTTNIKSTLNNGFPVIIFGSLKQPNGGSNINHAVVAYDYANYGFLNAGTKYRVHYGWSGYSSVWLESPTIGSNCYMKLG